MIKACSELKGVLISELQYVLLSPWPVVLLEFKVKPDLHITLSGNTNTLNSHDEEQVICWLCSTAVAFTL